MHTQTHLKRRKMPRGQSMVEFALAFPIFLLIIIGIMEFGRLFITYTSVYAAAREGARYGAAVDNLCDGNLELEAKRAGFLAGDELDVTATYELFDKELNLVSTISASACDPGNLPAFRAGDRVIVTASLNDFRFITGFIPGSNNGIKLESSAKRTIIQRVYLSWTLAPAATNQTGITPIATTGTTPDTTTTPDPDATATPTLPTCSTTSITSYTSDTSPYTVTLVNYGTEVLLDYITVYWEREQSDLVKVTMTGDGYEWTGFEEDSPATIDLTEENWVVLNGTQYLTITFEGFNNAKFNGVTLVMSDPITGEQCTIP